ncbi:MAG: glutathione S-transferase N-terminal domain-containing protein [Rhodospirillales bacterium]|nr:glutathione S-transferase N-terminal domain-containing protein [Rhodospirillales bacterium]
MIDLYSWGTPNGRKITIMLEELGIEYTMYPVNIMKDDQFKPEFLKISPNNKIPAIVDSDNGQTLFESGAIMMYLAEKTGKFMPTEGKARWATIEWLMFQMGGVGPMMGQAHHFVKYNPDKSEYASARYLLETKRLYKVIDERLADNEWLNGDSYSIADMAVWPWAARHDWQTVDLNDYSNVAKWYTKIANRPATQAGWNVPVTEQKIPMP